MEVFDQKNFSNGGNQAMAQNNVFSQIIKLIPKKRFHEWVHKYKADHKTRTLNTWTWFGALLFGQLTGHNSIRAIERAFSHSDTKIKNLGFCPVSKSTLADANHTRSLEVLEETFNYLLLKAKGFAPKSGFKFNGQVLALDSTVIKLSLSLAPWANYRPDDGGIKIHTAIDLAGSLPEFAVITPAIVQDQTLARALTFPKGSTVVFDRAYRQYSWLNRLNSEGVYFVSRLHIGTKVKVLECRKTDRTRGHICDQIVKIKSNKGQRDYKGKLRKISYKDPLTNKRLVFYTNRFDLATQTICDLYKSRWKVEIFFKTLKQNLKIKKFLGNSTHSVKAQILIALIAYLLVQLWRFMLKSNVSIPDVMAVFGIMLLHKMPLVELLKDCPRVVRHPPPLQLEFAL
jgi:hypothetical protein